MGFWFGFRLGFCLISFSLPIFTVLSPFVLDQKPELTGFCPLTAFTSAFCVIVIDNIGSGLLYELFGIPEVKF
jgi:hypothetical protein